MKKQIVSIAFSLLALTIFAIDIAVSNQSATLGNGNITFSYDLAADGNCAVSLLISNDDGASYTIIPSAISGDVGNQITPGTGKSIVWHPAADGMVAGTDYKAKIIARDNPDPITAPLEFVSVAGGTFNNGTSDVTVSSFYMDKCEITQAEYQAVMGVNPASGYGVGSSYPVYYVSWFKTIEYCNRRSMQEGYSPCYSYSSYGTNPDSWPSGWNTNNASHTNVSCNWTANGYRLPTEAEWQFAARGGNQTHNYTYSGSNDVNAVAWYDSNSSSTTHTAGGKLANELGLYDMSGNVFEWNWDIFGTYPSGAQNNPHGATSGSDRVARGGGWSPNAYYCTVSVRDYVYATFGYSVVGLRLLRVSP